MAKIIAIQPEDVCRQPVTHTGLPDPAKGVTVFGVKRKPEYDEAAEGDTLYLSGVKYLVTRKDTGTNEIAFYTDCIGQMSLEDFAIKYLACPECGHPQIASPSVEEIVCKECGHSYKKSETEVVMTVPPMEAR